MLFGLLKRKFFAIEDQDDDTSCKSSDRPHKRMQVEDASSIREDISTNLQITGVTGDEAGEDEVCGEREETEEELTAKVKEVEEMALCVIKEAERERAKLKKLREESMACMICHKIIQNPQSMKCGHSACYACLRKWWTQPPNEDDGAPIIDTDAESDFDEKDFTTHSPNLDEPAPEPRPRQCHQFPSAVYRQKSCPYCNEALTRRPIPNFRLREIASDLLEVSPHPQAGRKARFSRRRDIWHGIFHPEVVALQRPTKNGLAPAQRIRLGEDPIVAQRRERDQAIAEGQAAGALEALMERARRAEQARRAMARPRTARNLRFWD